MCARDAPIRDLPVVQWLRICLAMQGAWVQSLVGELRSYTLQLLNMHATMKTHNSQNF